MSLTSEVIATLEKTIEKAKQKRGDPRQRVIIVAVSKGEPVEKIKKAYELGFRDFGESRLQEAEIKQDECSDDINWHLIGTLQSKKVNKAIGKFALIHSVDSLLLAKKINEASKNKQQITSILLQVNTSKEESKHGFDEDGLLQVFPELLTLTSLKLCGLMTMAPKLSEDAVLAQKELEEKVRPVFRKLKNLQEKICTLYPELQTTFSELSMGMSQDYEVAVEEGATLVRIGSKIFES